MKTHRLIIILPATILILAVTIGMARDKPSETSIAAPSFTTTQTPNVGEQINWQVISGGGTKGSSAGYTLDGTVGQTAIGLGSSSSYRLSHGFWQVAMGTECGEDLVGDANNDETWNVGDAVYLINFVFKGGVPPTPFPTYSGDANCDCAVNVGDAVYQINFVFKGGPPPCDCETWLDNCGSPIRK
ncbi:MAG: hypothetical protein GY841_08565 [FCB group bacterium]|nr:hypothetical protein [FCB group bacterium]